MSKSGEKPKLAPFVALPWEIMNSKAYINLSPSSAKALPYFLGKYGREYGMAYVKSRSPSFSGKPIVFSYAEAERLGFATRTFSRVIQDLIAKGFIEMAGYGGLRGFCKTNNKFILSTRWERYDKLDFQAVPRYPSELP